jgi:tetratricopeptide (TPR) repeat protein
MRPPDPSTGPWLRLRRRGRSARILRADIYRTRCDWEAALEAARQSGQIAQSAGLTGHLAEAVNAEAAVFHTRGEYARAGELYERILEMPVDDRVLGIAYQNLALISMQSDRPAEAEPYFRESVLCFRRAGYPRGEVIALINLGRSRLDRKDPAAVTTLRDAESRALYLGDLELLAAARLNYAEGLLAIGDEERAHEMACIALGHFDVTDNAFRRIECLRILGDILRRRKEHEDARRFYERALSVAEQIEATSEISLLKERLDEVHE